MMQHRGAIKNTLGVKYSLSEHRNKSVTCNESTGRSVRPQAANCSGLEHVFDQSRSVGLIVFYIQYFRLTLSTDFFARAA